MATAQLGTVIEQLCRAVLRQEGAGETDGQLLSSFLDRQDEAAFEAIVRRHGPMVFGVCRRLVGTHHDAEDAFQATFLVLARKAASVRPRERLANWLHGVALRTALKAKTMKAKRRGREQQVPQMPEPEAASQDQWRDLQPLLDQELHGLPENYRLPIVLCDLEGKTIKEATRQLGWPQGTLAGRLARGRKLLAKRLANRGVVLSAGLLATVVAQQAPAAVPAALMSATVQAAARLAAGQAVVAGVVPARVALLTEGVLKAMLLTKLKSVMVTVALVGTLGLGVGLFACGTAPGQPTEGKQTETVAPQQTVAGQRTVLQPAVQKDAGSDLAGFYERTGHPLAAAFYRQLASGKDKKAREGKEREVPAPPRTAPESEFVITTRVLEAGAGQPKVLQLPRITLDDGQVLPSPLHLSDGMEVTLRKGGPREPIKIGVLFDVRVRRLGDNKVRLFCWFQKNKVEKSGDSEFRVVGSSVLDTQDVELGTLVKIVFQRDARGVAQQWVEITVDEPTVRAPR
jgi:RNA polymerase sigma factor (sigma-70 family)